MKKIYLDTNIWCRPFDTPSERIEREARAFFEILEGAYYEKRFEIIGSLILDDEIEQIEELDKRDAVKALVERFISIKITHFSKSLQDELKNLNLKDKDAFHLAFAIGNAGYFISADDKILSKSKEIEKRYGIKVMNPIKFMLEE